MTCNIECGLRTGGQDRFAEQDFLSMSTLRGGHAIELILPISNSNSDS